MKRTKNLFILSIFVMLSYTVSAQFGPVLVGGGGPPPEVPIDGGLTALLIAGAAYGGKKLYGKKK